MISVSILGASGYAGGELLRLLLGHPQVSVKQVTSRSLAGEPVTRVNPNLRKKTNLVFSHPDKLENCDLLFVALPNGVSMKLMSKLMSKAKKIIDLGADFRLKKKADWEKWYRQPHMEPGLVGKFVYGLTEIHREEIKRASYVACGGCEATVSILSLYPLVAHKLIGRRIIIDAKMSSSQAGAVPCASSHHPERSGVVRSYMPARHRHTAEIQQELGFGGTKYVVAISATALDMVRGLLVTIHTEVNGHVEEKDVWRAYRQEYGHEPFIRVVKEQQGLYRYPEPKILAGTNYCDIGFALDRENGRLVVIGAIDNLVKGTAGQAVQCMNVMYGYPETLGLEFTGLHPI